MQRSTLDAQVSLGKLIELDRRQRRTVFVVGDFLIDEYHDVRVDRISPEFPVPIMRTEATRPAAGPRRAPGGAGNVCQQLKHFNAEAHLFTAIDGHGSEVAAAAKISIPSHHDGFWPTPVKRRFFQGDQPLARWDVEADPRRLREDAAYKHVREKVAESFSRMIAADPPDAVIFSDYDKGFFDEATAHQMVAACRDRGIPTVVDPKKQHRPWMGCTVFKPNASEAATMVAGMTGHPAVVLSHLTNAEAVIITNAGSGMDGHLRLGGPSDYALAEQYFFRHDQGPVQAKSVIGAGDAFAAVLGLGLAHGMASHEAAEAAFLAGACYVGHLRNRPLCPLELRCKVDPVRGKVCSRDELKRMLSSLRYGGRTVAFTNGCFDLLHEGHLSTLNYAKGQADVLVVGLNSDESVRRLKGDGRPVRRLGQRADTLASLQCVDLVVPFDEDWPSELVEEIFPDVLVKGQDYQGKRIAGQDHCRRIALAPVVSHASTTNIVNSLQS